MFPQMCLCLRKFESYKRMFMRLKRSVHFACKAQYFDLTQRFCVIL